jgi:signal transduction histidine kinase
VSNQENNTEWLFAGLGEYGRFLDRLEEMRRRGKSTEARILLADVLTRQLREGVGRYIDCVQALDEASGSMLTQAGLVARCKLLGRELEQQFAAMSAHGAVSQMQQWGHILSDRPRDLAMLSKVVGEFGDFERIVPALPGTGEWIVQNDTQCLLAELYEINTRHLRLFGLARSVWRAWRRPDGRTSAFLAPDVDVSEMCHALMDEYAKQADPTQIQWARHASRTAGTAYQPYRFGRAAENVRVLAGVEYPRNAKPILTRPYVQVDDGATPHLVADRIRLEWSIKEVVNNALSASSHMVVSREGHLKISPLARHAMECPSVAVMMETRMLRKGLFRRRFVELLVRDEGTGIAAEDLPHVTKWGYSPRRQAVRSQAHLPQDIVHREIQIGGKGIGLAYALAVVTELGGSLTIDSTEGQGTEVRILLPVKSPWPVAR